MRNHLWFFSLFKSKGWRIFLLLLLFISIVHSFVPSFLIALLLLLFFIFSVVALIVRLVMTCSVVSAIEPASAVVMILVLIFTPAIYVSGYIHLAWNIDDYESVIHSIEAGDSKACAGDINCTIETISPVNVVFSWGGFTDNWNGACYDGSDDIKNALNVLEVLSPDNIDIRNTNVAGMYGGDMVGVHHMWGKWYLCSFT